jgi:hypothetical protein
MRLAIASVLMLALCGCSPVTETRERHAVHQGETAVLAHGTWSTLPVALSKDTVHRLTRAAEIQDQSIIKDLIDRGRAVEVSANTRVRVIGDSYNERQVRLEDGPYAGKTGWVPYEWLKPDRVRLSSN